MTLALTDMHRLWFRPSVISSKRSGEAITAACNEKVPPHTVGGFLCFNGEPAPHASCFVPAGGVRSASAYTLGVAPPHTDGRPPPAGTIREARTALVINTHPVVQAFSTGR
jgi:hypothetical protein